MIDVMLFGVLRMPYEMAMGSEMSRYQFYQRAQDAATRLEVAEAELAALKAQPAPTDPILERAQSSDDVSGFTHYDATMSDDEVIAKFMGQPAPTEAQGEDSARVEWISVEDRLPRPRKQVLIIAVGAGPQSNYTTDYYAGWISDSGEWSRWPHPTPPTHWMLLPDAPQPQEKP